MKGLALLSAFVLGGCSLVVNALESDPAVSEQADASTLPGADSSPGAPDAEPEGPPLYLLQVNLAGVAHEGVDYPGTWLADDGSYCGGNVYVSPRDIHNTVDDPLFQSNVYGIYSCQFGEGALVDGDYTVTFLFGEVYRGAGCDDPGTLSRIYDLLVEGSLVLDEFDVMAANGGCVGSSESTAPTPVTRSFTVTVGDGTLDVEIQGATNGLISAIRIESVARAP